jgi:hemoglobin/transferrin/lactoferrin receptor protein
MRYIKRSGSRPTAVLVGAAVSVGLGGAPSALAQEAPAELPPLQVTAKKAAKKKKAAPAAQPVPASVPVEAPSEQKPPVTVSGEPSIGTNTTDITSQDLERTNPSNVKGVFSGQPGIIVSSPIPISQKIYVNGIEETNLAVTVDGAAQNNKVFHHSANNFIDPSLLKAVRVDAGVAPADAGFGALAGSIAYETKDVGDLLDRDGFGGFSKNQFNTNGNVFTNNLAAYGMSNGFEILGSFNIGKGDEFDDGDGSRVYGSETDFLSGLGKVAYQAPSGDRFEVSHERISDDAMRPYRANFGFPRGFEPIVANYDVDRRTTVFNYSDATPQGWWDPKIVVAHTKASVDKPYVDRFTGAVTPTLGDAESLNGKVENKFSFGLGNVIAGIDFINSETSLVDTPDRFREKSNVVGGYAQARLKPFEGTRLSFGGRTDHQKFTGSDQTKRDDNGLSGNISGEQDLFGRFLTFKAGYSHVWAGVLLNEAYAIYSPTTGGDIADTTADNFTTGLVARYGGWTLEGTIFRTEIEDARVYPGLRDVKSEGYELGATYDWGNGFLRVRYANIDTTVTGEVGGSPIPWPGDAYYGQFLTTPIGERITITGVHTFVGTGIRVGADAVIAPSYDRVIEGNDPFPSFNVWNTFVEYRPDVPFDLTLRADVLNVFDEQYYDRATYGQEYLSDPRYYALAEPGRSFLFTATSKF